MRQTRGAVIIVITAVGRTGEGAAGRLAGGGGGGSSRIGAVAERCRPRGRGGRVDEKDVMCLKVLDELVHVGQREPATREVLVLQVCYVSDEA